MTAVEVSATGAVANTRAAGASRWAALSGVLFAVLLAISFAMTAPEPDASKAAKVQAWDHAHTGLLTWSSAVSVIGVVVGLYFLTWLYSVMTRGGSTWMGTLYLVGVAIWAVSGTVSAGISAMLGTDTKHLSTDSLQLLASFNQNFIYAIAIVGLSAMYLGAGFLIRRTGLLPGWLAWVSWVLALLAVTVILGFVSLLGSALWVIAVSVILAARQPAGS